MKRIRDELFAHIQRLPFAWHTRHQTGEMIQRCTSDVEVVRTFVCNQLVEVMRTLIVIAVYLWAMFAMNTKLALVSRAFVPVVALSSGLFYVRIAVSYTHIPGPWPLRACAPRTSPRERPFRKCPASGGQALNTPPNHDMKKARSFCCALFDVPIILRRRP